MFISEKDIKKKKITKFKFTFKPVGWRKPFNGNLLPNTEGGWKWYLIIYFSSLLIYTLITKEPILKTLFN